jgi:hypothetical protein
MVETLGASKFANIPWFQFVSASITGIQQQRYSFFVCFHSHFAECILKI